MTLLSCASARITLESKSGLRIIATDIRFTDPENISFKRTDDIRSFEVNVKELSETSLENIKASLRPKIQYKLEVSSLGTSRKTVKTWKTDYGSKSQNIDVSRRFKVHISTHSYLPSLVILKVYSIQGKDEKAAYLLKSIRKEISNGYPIIEEFSDSASLKSTRYAAAGYDVKRGNDDVDFYVVASHPDSGLVQEWTSSDYVLSKIRSGEIELLSQERASKVANKTKVKLHRSDKSY